MAKNIPRETKPKSHQPTGHSFLATRQSDLSGIPAAKGKGPHKDQAGTRLVAPAIKLGEPEPGS